MRREFLEGALTVSELAMYIVMFGVTFMLWILSLGVVAYDLKVGDLFGAALFLGVAALCFYAALYCAIKAFEIAKKLFRGVTHREVC